MTAEEKVRMYRKRIGAMVADLRAEGLSYVECETELKLSWANGNNAQRLMLDKYKRVLPKTRALSEDPELKAV